MDNKKLSWDFETHRKPAEQILLSSIYKQETEAQSQWLLKGHILSGRYKIQNQVTWFQEKDERRVRWKHWNTPYVLLLFINKKSVFHITES